MHQAEDALHRWLADGPVEAAALKRLAEKADIGWRTLERAKRSLRVESVKTGGPGNKRGPWIWLLSEDRQPGALASQESGGTKRRPPAEDRQPPLADFSVWDVTEDWGSW